MLGRCGCSCCERIANARDGADVISLTIDKQLPQYDPPALGIGFTPVDAAHEKLRQAVPSEPQKLDRVAFTNELAFEPSDCVPPFR